MASVAGQFRMAVVASVLIAAGIALGSAAPAKADFGPAPTRSVTVTKPAASAVCRIGELCTVAWETSGAASVAVRISLRKVASEEPLRTIAVSAPNSGSFAWSVPTDLTEGSFQVRVEETGPGAPWDDGEMFSIRKSRLVNSEAIERRKQLAPLPVPCPEVPVSKPSYNQRCRVGAPCAIAWDTASLAGYATVFLHIQQIDVQHPNGVEGGGFPVANNGSYDWVVPENFSPVENSGYRIHLVTPDHACSGVSALFTVSGKRRIPLPSHPVPQR